MTKKFFDMIGYDPSAVQGGELTDVYDTEKVVAARQEYEAAVSSYEVEQESLEQDAVEFFNPISQEGLDQLRNTGGLFIPGVRLPKIRDFNDQNFASFLTVPAAIAEERVRLGGSMFSNPFTSFDPGDKEVGEMIEKYGLDTSLPGFGRLLEAESLEDLEARAIVTQRRQQRLEQIYTDNQGVTGLVGMVGMSLLDPTLYASGGAATGMLTTRIVNSTTKTGAALRFTADGLTKGEKFKVGAAGYLLGEAPIELANATQQEDFDPAMTLAFMAVAPLVGGAFNSLGKSNVDSPEFKAAIALDEAISKGIVGQDGGAVGAAQRGALPITVDEEGLPGAPPRATGWTFGTPLNFLARSADPLVRSVADRLSWNPNTRSRQGTTAAEAQRRVYNSLSVVLRETRMAAKEYFGSGVLSPSTEQLREFFIAVGQHRTGYLESTNPAVIRAANALSQKYQESLAYVKDPNWVPGMDLPPGPAAAGGGAGPTPPTPPVAPATPPVAPATPPVAPATPPVAPGVPQAINTVDPDAPQTITGAGPAPSPAPAPEGRFVVTDKEGTVVFASDVREEASDKARDLSYSTPPDETFVMSDTVKSPYFGRKSFGGEGLAETAPSVEPGKGSDYFGRKSFRERAEAIEKVRQDPEPDALSAAEAKLAEINAEITRIRGEALDSTEGRSIAVPGPQLRKLRSERDAVEKQIAKLRAKAPEPAAKPATDAEALTILKSNKKAEDGSTRVTLSDGTETGMFYDKDGAGLPGWYLDEDVLYGHTNPASRPGFVQPWLGSNKAEALSNLPDRLKLSREKASATQKPAAKPAEIPEAKLREVPEEAPTGDPVADAIEALAAAGPKREAFEEVAAAVERMNAPAAKAVAQAYAGLDAPPKTKNKAIAVIREHFAKQLIERKKDVRATTAPKPPRPPAPDIVKQAKEDMAPAAEKVIEVEDTAPSRVLMARQLSDYIKQAEELAGKMEPGSEVKLLDALAYLQKVYKGQAMGTSQGFRARYAEASNRLAQVLEDLPEGDSLLAAIVEDMDSGMGRFAVDEAAKRIAPESRTTSSTDARREVAQVEAEARAIAEAYDGILAAFEYKGKGARPSTAKGVAVGAAATSAVALASAEFWFGGMENEELAAVALVGAAVGSAIAAVATKGRQKSWEMNSPGIAVFVGPDAPGADLKALKVAKDMETSGVDRNKIWKETGWGRGPLGEWIVEADEPMGGLIDDLFDQDIPIDKALRSKRILEIEPRLRDTVIQTWALLRNLQDTGAQGVAEVYDPLRPSLAVDRNMSGARKLATLLHELNHVSQSFRGGKGAYEGDFVGQANQAIYDGEYLDDAIQFAAERGDTAEVERLRIARKDAQTREDPYYAYMSQDIEAESRMVEKRIGLSRKQRRERPPWEDFDVPEDDLWTGTAAMRAFSLAADLRTFRADDWWTTNVKEGYFEDGELEGSAYWRMDAPDGQGVTVWTEEVDAGEVTFNWDWNDNIDNDRLFEDNANASPAQAQRAFAFAQTAFERILREQQPNVMTFEGLKKAKPGRDASGHERVQEFLMGRGDTPGYVASKGTWKSKVKDPATGDMVEVTRSAFAYSREGMDLGEVWQGIRLGNVSIEVIPTKGSARPVAPASQPTPGTTPTPAAATPGGGYRGLYEWEEIDFDPLYQNIAFNKQGFERVLASPQFRNNKTALGNRFGDILLRSDPERYEELGGRLGISAQDAAWRTGRKYIDTVTKLMNPARGKGTQRAQRINPADREAAKEIVRDMLAQGGDLDDTAEDAMELILDIVAPARKQNAESPRARPRLKYQLRADTDADIADMFEWDAEKLFVSYARHMSGYAGILRAGYRSVAELNGEIARIEAAADFDPQRKVRAGKEAETIKLLRDAVLGVPPDKGLLDNDTASFVANQLRRLNFGNLMNNTGFLAMSEVAGALTQVNIVKMFRMFPQYQRYITLARAGDARAQESIYYMADAMMGHGSAQLRSRVGHLEDRASGEAPSLENNLEGVADRVDRFTRKAGNLTGRLSGMTPIQEFLRMTVVTSEAQNWVSAARNGRPPYSARRMASMGIDAPMWQRISGELRRWGDVGSPDTRRQVPNMDIGGWEDAESLNFFINALDRNANRIVMEGDVGHTAFWIRNSPVLQIFFQFLNFPMNAFSKHLGYALSTRDMRAATEMFAMAVGGLTGYTARVLAQANAQDTAEEKKKILDERLTNEEMAKAFVYYSAHGSVVPNAIDMALWGASYADIPNPIPGHEGGKISPLFTKTRASGLPGNPVTGNPTISRINQLPQVAGGLFEGTKFSEQDVQKAIQYASPLGNHIALSAFLDRALEFLPDEEGSIEDEVQ